MAVPFLCRLLPIVLALFALASCAGRGGWGRSEFSIVKNGIYTPAAWPAPLKADVFRPVSAKPVPAVVLLHPTGVVGRDLRWTMRGLARKLASRGYFVLNATYRSAPAWRYPAPMKDMDVVLDWIEENAELLGIDPDRIALWGYSAGGHLALLSGLADHRVKAVVAGAAPADLTLLEGGRLIHAFAGGTFEERPNVYYALSPAYWVDAYSPPMFLYHGEHDQIVPVEQAYLMKSALDAARVPNEFVVLERKAHVTAFLFGDEAENQAVDFLDRTLRR